MVANGTKITGLVLDVSADQARVYLNNGKDCWYDQKTITDLFEVSATKYVRPINRS